MKTKITAVDVKIAGQVGNYFAENQFHVHAKVFFR
jgi:hypothetical protein